jgi:hypothetical protein
MHGSLLRFFSTLLTYRTEHAIEHVIMHALQVEERGVELFKSFELLGGGARNVIS